MHEYPYCISYPISVAVFVTDFVIQCYRFSVTPQGMLYYELVSTHIFCRGHEDVLIRSQFLSCLCV